jgi:putative FmdB family regulatory protein
VPIYEYACRKCNHTLDALQKLNDAPLVECPECGEPELRRLISAPRFRLKGQGWYETDFKKDKQRNLQSSDGEPPKEKAADKAVKADAGSKDAGGKDSGSKDSGKAIETPKPAKEAKKETKAPAD